MDLKIAFGDTTMITPVYIKMDAHDQLLLSEGVCRQLGILQYHPSVESWRGGKKKSVQRATESPPESPASEDRTAVATDKPGDARVPTVRVNLLQSTRLLPHQSRIVEVAVTCVGEVDGSYLLEPAKLECGWQVDPSLLRVAADQETLAVIFTPDVLCS